VWRASGEGYFTGDLGRYVKKDSGSTYLVMVSAHHQVKANQSHYRPEVPRGFQEVKVPRLHDNGPGWW